MFTHVESGLPTATPHSLLAVHPTPVGNAAFRRAAAAATPVHPHACGERPLGNARLQQAHGSPPRLWGTRHAAERDTRPRRFTPTPVGNAPTSPACRSAATVHPHACGERAGAAGQLVAPGGSPPRLWGTPEIRTIIRARSRFTPTPVGNARSTSGPTAAAPVHPHACGERHPTTPVPLLAAGSPPRLWGTRISGERPPRLQRFTPTPVGNAGPDDHRASNGPVHPHACGERAAGETGSSTFTGSPPRLWGTPAVARVIQNESRFTPTPVGNTKLFRRRTARWRFTPTPVGNTRAVSRVRRSSTVHPHACGEHAERAADHFAMGGSPPRLWGTPSVKVSPRLRVRFTPTPVGNTRSAGPPWRRRAVHPHACGEHTTRSTLRSRSPGSPPRLWGTLPSKAQLDALQRFTPTPVGNTLTAPCPWPPPTVHPHACGEHWPLSATPPAPHGSPPRLWGTLPGGYRKRLRARFTPTPVGNAPWTYPALTGGTVHPHACGERRFRFF